MRPPPENLTVWKMILFAVEWLSDFMLIFQGAFSDGWLLVISYNQYVYISICIAMFGDNSDEWLIYHCITCINDI